jgi:hypothetical protein
LPVISFYHFWNFRPKTPKGRTKKQTLISFALRLFPVVTQLICRGKRYVFVRKNFCSTRYS